jgi:hypothetical protein
MGTQWELTLSVCPQEGTSRLPVVEYTALKEPLSGAVVMSLCYNVVIGGWI